MILKVDLIISDWTDLDTSAFTIATNKKVHIFDQDSGAYTVNAKLTVTDDSIDQLSLAYDTDTYSILTTCADGGLAISADHIKSGITIGDSPTSGLSYIANDLIINNESPLVAGISIIGINW